MLKLAKYCGIIKKDFNKKQNTVIVKFSMTDSQAVSTPHLSLLRGLRFYYSHQPP